MRYYFLAIVLSLCLLFQNTEQQTPPSLSYTFSIHWRDMLNKVYRLPNFPPFGYEDSIWPIYFGSNDDPSLTFCYTLNKIKQDVVDGDGSTITGRATTFSLILKSRQLCDVTYTETLRSTLNVYTDSKIRILTTNTAPTASSTTISGTFSTPTKIDVTSMIKDANSDPLTVNFGAVSPLGCGTFATESNGVGTLTPTTGFRGTCSVSYTVSDTLATAQGTVNIKYSGPLVLYRKSATLHWRTFRSSGYIVSNLLDGTNGDFVSIGTSTPQNTVLAQWKSPNVELSALTLFLIDQDLTTPYSATNGTHTLTENIVLRLTNQIPSAPTLKSLTLHWKQLQDGFTITNLLQGSVDPDNDPLSLVDSSIQITSDAVSFVLTATTLKIQGKTNPILVNGQFTITYSITDGVAILTNTITVNVFNNPPVAKNDIFTVNSLDTFTIDVLSNDYDLDSPQFDTLSISSITSHGTTYLPDDYEFSIDPKTKKVNFKAKKLSTKVVNLRYTVTDGIAVDSAVVVIDLKGKITSSSSTVQIGSLLVLFLIYMLF